MATRLVPASIEVCLDVEAGRHFTRADPGLVEQVLMNLIVNARDAIVGHGRILVRVTRLDLTAQPWHDAPPGPYVAITVEDTGVGIRPDVRPYLFEPFFTTKVAGEGTGLGLATSYGIVRQAGGFITVDSDVGTATFTVYLPRCRREARPRRCRRRSRGPTANWCWSSTMIRACGG
jgi:two-component system cell cycle sensor histidine kinase/response regulator CckA